MAINDEERRSLNNAGISSRYHDKPLGKMGEEGQRFKEMIVENEIQSLLLGGVGMTFVGQGYRTRELFVAVARAIHLRGLGVHMTAVDGLIELLEDPTPMIDRKALFLDRFVSDGEFPFTRSEQYRVSSLLIEWVDAGRALCPMVWTQDNDLIKSWWGKDVADIVTQHNEIHRIQGTP